MLCKGLAEEELFSFLSKKRGEDLCHSHILSSMCTVPHPVAVKAHLMFMETNLGDPGLFPGTASLERLLIERLGDLFHHREAGGYATSGGTESNIQALRIAKAQKKVDEPNVVIPETSHFSFKKACDMLGIRMKTVPADRFMRTDINQVGGAIDKNTIALVGIAGSTEYGMVDDIAALAAIAEDEDLFLHVDAAFGGLVIPFLPNPPAFDFALPGVSSIAVDPHKMGMSTLPAGALLVRDQAMLGLLNIDTPYLTVKQEYTLAGTRPGASVAGALAVLDYMGRDGMEAVVAGCMKNTHRLIRGMETFGFPRAVTPDVNVATFQTDRPAPKDWVVSHTRRGHMRIICMPHVTADMIEQFLVDIGECKNA
jgi:tyrosine decarboxylase/aspartate 1-decarboxylase